MRADGQEYSHWGMEFEYGPKMASKAIAEVHSSEWIEVMREGIQDLEAEARSSEEFASTFSDRKRSMKAVPAETLGATERHFDYLVEAVNLLLKSQIGR